MWGLQGCVLLQQAVPVVALEGWSQGGMQAAAEKYRMRNESGPEAIERVPGAVLLQAGWGSLSVAILSYAVKLHIKINPEQVSLQGGAYLA